MVAGLPQGITQTDLFLLQLAQDPSGRGQRLLRLAFPGANDPLGNITSNPLITGTRTTGVQDKQIFNAQLSQFDAQYGSLFQLGASMSPVAQQLGQQATLGILQEQLTGQAITAGGGLGALGVLNGFGGGGGIPGLGGGGAGLGPGFGAGGAGGVGSVGQLAGLGVNVFGSNNAPPGLGIPGALNPGMNPALAGIGGLPGIGLSGLGAGGGIPGAGGNPLAMLGQMFQMLMGLMQALGQQPPR